MTNEVTLIHNANHVFDVGRENAIDGNVRNFFADLSMGCFDRGAGFQRTQIINPLRGTEKFDGK